VVVVGNYAYVALDLTGLGVISISDPANPTQIGFCDLPGWLHGVAVSGNYAYLAAYLDGLRVVSISDPTNPVAVGYYDTPGEAMSVALGGNYAYVADESHGMRMVRVSDPTNPVEVGYYDIHHYALGVAVAGDLVYVAAYDAGLQIYRPYGAGIEEGRPTHDAGRMTLYAGPTIVRGILELPGGSDFPVAKSRGLETSPTFLLDIAGRKVLDLHPGPNDVSRLAPGVYFVQRKLKQQAQSVSKIVVTR
jgi:hypothetical protein